MVDQSELLKKGRMTVGETDCRNIGLSSVFTRRGECEQARIS